MGIVNDIDKYLETNCVLSKQGRMTYIRERISEWNPANYQHKTLREYEICQKVHVHLA